jgi:hypothetical protein
MFTKFLNFKKFQNFKKFKKARGSRIAITVVCPISDVQLKIPRKLFKLPVNSSVAVNSLENNGIKFLNFKKFQNLKNLKKNSKFS